MTSEAKPRATGKIPPVKLTKGYIDRIKPGIKDEFHWDTATRGFAVRATTTGRLSFIVQGRVEGSGAGAIRITIGPYGVFTVDQARDVAREHLRSMRKGLDPRAAKKADATERVTLHDLSEQYASRPGKLKESSAATIRRHVRTTFEDWSGKPIASITEDMCKARYRRMLTKGLRGKRGAPGQANQAFSVLGALLAYAGRQLRRADGSPLCSRAPVDALKDDRVRLKPRTSRILDNKVGTVWLKLTDWRAAAHNRDTLSGVDLIRFLLLTGLRIGEASSLKWEQVNLEERYFTLPNPKNANPVALPLSAQAVELLKRRPRVKDKEGSENPFVFPSWSAAGHIRDPRDLMVKLSKVAGNKITPHDLRRTYTNIALRSCRIEKFRTDLLTNHLTRDVTAAHYFDTTNLQWLAPEAQMIADWLDKEAAIAASANVERLEPRAEAA